jgi:ubiquinone/menaquinone biosynthesis C-methylase UbiE
MIYSYIIWEEEISMAPMSNSIPNVETLAVPTADEVARQRFVSSLRKSIMADLSPDMRAIYEGRVAPAYAAQHGAPPADPVSVRKAMKDEVFFKMWSAARYDAQEMVWESVRPQIERSAPALRDAAKTAANVRAAGGSLTLDPDLELPAYIQALDIHLMPGNFFSEFTDDDVVQGALYSQGTAVFSGGLQLRSMGGGVAATMAHYLNISRPDFAPKRMADLGCTTGGNLLPYLDVYPDLEAYGIDVSAPQLRYGHARAEALGYKVHFRQENAEHLSFDDNSMDLIVSSFFFHELPLAVTKNVLAEIHRVLKPGGIMIHQELPPNVDTDAYYGFYLDWDAYYNNEPFYAQFRAQSLPALCANAGFAPDKYFQTRIHNRGTVSDDIFQACARGEIAAPQIGNGVSWFVFGAQK